MRLAEAVPVEHRWLFVEAVASPPGEYTALRHRALYRRRLGATLL